MKRILLLFLITTLLISCESSSSSSNDQKHSLKDDIVISVDKIEPNFWGTKYTVYLSIYNRSWENDLYIDTYTIEVYYQGELINVYTVNLKATLKAATYITTSVTFKFPVDYAKAYLSSTDYVKKLN